MIRRIPLGLWLALGVIGYLIVALFATEAHARGRCPRASDPKYQQEFVDYHRAEAVGFGLVWPVSWPLLILSRAAADANPALAPCQRAAR